MKEVTILVASIMLIVVMVFGTVAVKTANASEVEIYAGLTEYSSVIKAQDGCNYAVILDAYKEPIGMAHSGSCPNHDYPEFTPLKQPLK